MSVETVGTLTLRVLRSPRGRSELDERAFPRCAPRVRRWPHGRSTTVERACVRYALRVRRWSSACVSPVRSGPCSRASSR
eukprot:11182169-Lingulodinium_polyedra.AAC.1